MEPEKLQPLPIADEELGLVVLKRLAKERSLLVALETMHEYVGDAFQITLPGFQPAVLVGPETNRYVLVSEREHFRWRNQTDPVAKLLRQGILVQDGEAHQRLRDLMEPMLQRPYVLPHIPAMTQYTDDLIASWPDGGTVDMLVEMRKLALLILMGTTFKVEFGPDLERLWSPILKSIKYISPGFWIVWPNMPRFGYGRALQAMDDYLYGIIRERRANPGEADNLLDALLLAGLDDDLIRDQLLTMLIAGHDTSTASLTWTLYLLTQHPEHLQTARQEVETVLGTAVPTAENIQHLDFLDMVFKEALRLYPPIHVGNRMAKEDLGVAGYEIKAGTRVMYSIYLAHRDKKHWEEPESFCPARFDRTVRQQRPPLTYVPFGGGPRNCIGATFAQIEARVVLGRILQQVELTLAPNQTIKPYMGATLEPKPGVKMIVKKL
jgi:cytochrome P450